MEETPIKAASVKLTHRSGIGVGQDRLRAVFRFGDVAKAMCDGINGLVPTDADELSLAFRADALHRVEQALGMIDALQIARDFLAEEAFGEGMFGIAAEFDGPSIADGHDHAAGVWTIMWTDNTNGQTQRSIHLAT